MRIASLFLPMGFLLIGAIGLAAGNLPEDGLGNWKVNPVRSTKPYPGSLVLRIEPHPKGEVFTLDRVDGQGREHNLRRRPVSRREAQGFGAPRLRGIAILAPIG